MYSLTLLLPRKTFKVGQIASEDDGSNIGDGNRIARGERSFETQRMQWRFRMWNTSMASKHFTRPFVNVDFG